MRCSHSLAVFAMAACFGFACVSARAQASAPYSNVGKTPTPQEIQSFDIAVATDGKGLPPGSGTAKSGAPVFMAKCAPCHGRNLEGTKTDSPKPSRTGSCRRNRNSDFRPSSQNRRKLLAVCDYAVGLH